MSKRDEWLFCRTVNADDLTMNAVFTARPSDGGAEREAVLVHFVFQRCSSCLFVFVKFTVFRPDNMTNKIHLLVLLFFSRHPDENL